MQEPSLAIFSNFFIDNEERFLRMKDSFNSFKDINPNEWIINIRGSLKNQAGEFLKKKLGDKLQLSFLQNSRGWLHDSSIIANKITSRYVFYWIEDQILIAPLITLKQCIAEMSAYNADQLCYSWFIPHNTVPFKIVKVEKQGRYISLQKIDSDACDKIRNECKKYRVHRYIKDFYIISLASIMSKSFFNRILKSPKPYLKRWDKSLPFDFEKRSKDNVLPVIWHAVSKEELFVPIDDDGGLPGYSLISRGQYPNRVSREQMKQAEFGSKNKLMLILKKITPKPIRKIGLFIKRICWTLNI